MTTLNNYELIKSMSIDEMLDFFAKMRPKGCALCMGVYTGCLRAGSCKFAIKDWLLSDKPCGS